MYSFCLVLQYVGIIIILFEIIYIFRQRSSKLQLLMLTVAVSTLINFIGYLMEMRATSQETAIIAVKTIYLGKPYIILGCFLFIIEYYKVKMPGWFKCLLVGMHISVTAMVLLCEYNTWYYSSIGYTQEGLFPHLVLNKGFAYIIYHSLLVGYVVFIVILGVLHYRKTSSWKERENILCLSCVSVVSCLGFLVYLTGITKGYDSTLPAYVGSTTLLFISMRRYNLLDPMDFVRENVMDDLADGLVVLDRESKLIYTNPMVQKVYPGLCTDECPAVLEELEKLCNNGENAVKGDRVYHVQQKEIVRGQTVYGKMYVVADITEGYQYTIQLEKQKAIAEKASHAKGDFLASMSHEIRTPINAVLGMNEMILREAKDEEILNYASHAYDAGKVLLSIINDVLDISKIEAGKLEIVDMEYDLYTLVNDCYNMTAGRAEKKNLRFVFSVDENLPSMLCGDMVHIRQIVVNFLTNAVKYTDEGSVELIVNGQTVDGEFMLQFSVKDTGIGLAEESIENLFDSFQRFDLGRNQSVEGTGLGLAICRQLAELMGGTIHVESVYGEGSVFSCSIPQKIVNGKPVGRMAIGQKSAYNMLENTKKFTARDTHILVVDDVEMNLVVFTNLLKGHGLIIDTAQSGEQCLELIQKQKYDIVFMDHMMPGMDGMETYEHMKTSKHPNNDTPVIMLTANAISGEREKYMAAGFAAYLTKPVQSAKLNEVLLEYLPKDKVSFDETDSAAGEDSEHGGVKAGAPGSEADRTALEKAANLCRDKRIFDVMLGLRYTGDDVGSYRDILASYVKNGKKELNNIALFYENETWKDYVTKVHALKSVSLTVGAGLLSELAAELERAGKAGDYEKIKERNDELLGLYGKVLQIGEQVLGILNTDVHTGTAEESDETPKEIHEITEQELNVYREYIIAAADGFDSDEIVSLCKELSGRSFNGKVLDDAVRKIAESAEDFECEQAKEQAVHVFEELLG